jgi:hypothetical protein
MNGQALVSGRTMQQMLTTEPLRIRRYEPRDELYLKNGYNEAGRGVVGPFDCIFYEREILG